ncbi:hypothetical protein [Nostoc sp. C117]|uniref:hypothetical protein n=1 Tax=Nostoc sp. C117 TaxID=3349875 RepID=UPI00370D545F
MYYIQAIAFSSSNTDLQEVQMILTNPQWWEQVETQYFSVKGKRGMGKGKEKTFNPNPVTFSPNPIPS